ncbi:MAG TPA: hypothetical protein VFL83_22655 [Anaeromyxobacter sp.]|nr:hypothetical protein [Anaeromyxobacter sp.]
MAYRIVLKDGPGAVRIAFQGVLDLAALREITTVVRRSPGLDVTLVLETGTEVDPECIEPLRRLEGVAVRPASPFLERWLRCCR